MLKYIYATIHENLPSLQSCLLFLILVTKDRDERITHMYETVLNHTYPGKWEKAKTTHLVCKIDGDDTPIIIKNDPKGNGNNHAEALLINALNENSKVKEIKESFSYEEDLLTDQFIGLSIEGNIIRANSALKTDGPELLKIKVYINNSPCSASGYDCTEKLVSFLEKNIRVRMRLYVTNLYNIRRESCKEEGHYKSVHDLVHLPNYDGLKNLMQHARCEVKAFTENDWKDLFNIVDVSKAVRVYLLANYGTKIEKNDRSRKDEDKRIMDDLEYIQNNVAPHETDYNYI